jgi:hypothetical protein
MEALLAAAILGATAVWAVRGYARRQARTRRRKLKSASAVELAAINQLLREFIASRPVEGLWEAATGLRPETSASDAYLGVGDWHDGPASRFVPDCELDEVANLPDQFSVSAPEVVADDITGTTLSDPATGQVERALDERPGVDTFACSTTLH